MRAFSPDEAKKLHSKLILRGAKSEKMQLLSLAFDIDAQKFTEASNRLTNLLKSADSATVVNAMEEKIRLQRLRGDSPEDIKKTASELAAIAPKNTVAAAILDA